MRVAAPAQALVGTARRAFSTSRPIIAVVSPRDNPALKSVPKDRADFLIADNLDTMLVHGGRGQAGLLEDLWSWDNLRSQWEQLDGAHSEGPAGGVRPAARRGHSCALLGATRKLMVLGGR